jgi:hypothetical protein
MHTFHPIRNDPSQLLACTPIASRPPSPTCCLQAAAAQQRIRELVAGVKADRLPAAKALAQVRQLEQDWTASSAAARAADADVGGEAAPAFEPVVGQRVAVRSMGGSLGTVTAAGSRVGAA